MPYQTTNLGPLTTPFTASPDCFTPSRIVNLFNDLDDGTLGVSCFADSETATLQPASTCFPSIPTSDSPGPYDTVSVYSPGNICPAGFATACSLSRTEGLCPYTERQEKSLWDALEVGETAIGCCPSGHSCYDHGLGGLYCASTQRGHATVTAVSFTNEYDCRHTTTSTVLGGGGKYGRGDAFYSYAPRVVLVRQATDPAPTSIAPDDDPYYVEPSRELSGGAIAGIAVGSIVGGLVLIMTALCCYAKHIGGGKKGESVQPPPYEAVAGGSSEREETIPLQQK